MEADNRQVQPLAQEIQQALEAYADPVKRDFLPRFFKTGKGQYGEGDRFLGVMVPFIRRVTRQYKEASLANVEQLLQSPWHECRMCALLILVEQFKKGDACQRKVIYDFYLAHTQRINNWDLVDLTAPAIIGEYLVNQPRTDLYKLADSTWLWNQRIAVVATLTLIRRGDFMDILALAERLLTHRHDLMHKAVGWMLREMGKRDKDLLLQFLEKHSTVMPRTMLRYSIEKLPEEERHYFIKTRI